MVLLDIVYLLSDMMKRNRLLDKGAEQRQMCHQQRLQVTAQTDAPGSWEQMATRDTSERATEREAQLEPSYG